LKILIAPLDWGLGHTTRCIPLIQYFKAGGHEVYAAAEAGSARLLMENFKDLNILPLKGYNIHYSKNKATFSIKILQQIPKILEAIKAEHAWLQKIQEEMHFDLIVADNRYGLYHEGVCSVILTHQLQIQSGVGSWVDGVLRRMHYKLLHRFNACWIVDEKEGYSGRLAHPVSLPFNANYIGILSQFSNSRIDFKRSVLNRLLILLSGPEPMRTILENKLLHQAKTMTAFQFIVVGGTPLGQPVSSLPSHITYHTHLNAVQLLNELELASLVICRSGYSTIMDLALLQKKAILIPTPGQSEQEYLAAYLTKNNLFHTVSEQGLSLEKDIVIALRSNNLPVPAHSFIEHMDAVVAPFLRNIPQ
jgi:hypothetical protein